MIFLGFVAVLLLLALLFLLYGGDAGRGGHRAFVLLASCLLALQSGLRNVAVGPDTYAYSLQFERDTQLSWRELNDKVADYYLRGMGKDPGYPVFTKLAQYVTPTFQAYLLLVAVIFWSALARFILRNTQTVGEALLSLLLYLSLFYSFFSITGIRQTLATALVLWSYESAVKRRRPWLFVAMVAMASTLHKSALLFLPFYLVAQLRPRKLHYWILAAAFPAMMAHADRVLAFAGGISGYDKYAAQTGAGTLAFTAILLLFSGVAFWRLSQVLLLSPDARPLFNAVVLAAFLTPMTWVHPAAMRLVQYFSVFLLVLLPQVVRSLRLISTSSYRVGYGISMMFLLVFTVWKGITVFEYAFFWQEMELPVNYFR